MKRAISVILSLLLLVSVTPVALATGDGDAMDWAALKEALKAGGEITLQNDVAAPEGAAALSVPKASTVTLDLNGHTVDRGLDSAKKKGCVIEVLGELTVTDTSAEQTGAITGGYTDGTGGGVWVRADGRFTLAGGAVTGNTAKNVGGGVYLSGSGASFTMTGGAITGNAAKNGGGLAMDNTGSAEVSGGAISDNTANNNGGGVWFGRGTSFTLAGGSVTGNTAAAQGGGVYINDGAFDYTGGSVANNQQAAGGDIAAKSGSYLPTCYGFEVAGLSLHPMADDPTEEEIDAAENEILLFNATEDTTIYLVWRSTGELEGDLDDHVAAFEQAKVNADVALAALSRDGDSDACGGIIAAAREAMETLAYDYAVSPEDNMAAVAAIVTQAETDLEAQRAQPQPLRLALLPVVGLHLLQHGFIAGKEDVAGHVGGRRQYFVHAVAHPHGLELHLHGQLVVHGGQPRVELRESDQVRHPAFGVFRRGLAAPPARVFRPGDGRVFELQRVAEGDIEPLDLLHGHILQLFGVPFKGHIPHVGVVGDDDLSVISRGTQNTRL